MKKLKNQSGVSIIAAIFIIVILAFMGMVFLTLSTSTTSTSINELQSTRALYVAEGGLQYTLAFSKDNIPNYSTNGIWTNLGAGQFKVDTPAYLTSNIAAGAATIPVVFDPTASFPATGRIAIRRINPNIGYNLDFGITYLNKDANNFLIASGGLAHSLNDSVYPAAKVTTTIAGSSCASLATIDVGEDTGGFAISRPFYIDNEYFLCATKTQYQFQTCQRCYLGSSTAAHTATLATPTNAAFTAGAGILLSGAYYYRVSATNVIGETLASAETSLVLAATGGVNVNWGAVPGAAGYKIYGRSTGAEQLIAAVGAVTTYLDNGYITPSGALPSSNTTSSYASQYILTSTGKISNAQRVVQISAGPE